MKFIKIILIFLSAFISLVGILFLYNFFKTPTPINLNVDNETIIKPYFFAKEFQFEAGTAFIVEYQDRLLLLTAHHLFSPAGGLSKTYSTNELKDASPSVRGYYLYSGVEFGWEGMFLPLKESSDYIKGNLTTDLAVFNIENAQLSSLEFSKTPAVEGDTVYLYARLKNQGIEQSFFHKATVTKSSGNILEYKYANQLLDPRATSGAPVLNNEGKVVGMNLAASGLPLFSWKGKAISIISIKEHFPF